MNFSNVYAEETFYKEKRVLWVNCTDITGVDCFCDNEASVLLAQRMADLSPQGIHFIDSGNYHYVSKFFIDKIPEDFILVLFDHHPDMQPSLFEDILTCGSWVKVAMDTNPHLKKVVLVGTSDELLEHIESKYLNRIVEFRESRLEDWEAWRKFYAMQFDLPIYISIDKDVLSPEEICTNWDQGKATLEDLKRLLLILLKYNRLIGVDICGECSYSIQGILDANLQKDDRVNRQLMELFEKRVKW
jgi:arginase family enzyme